MRQQIKAVVKRVPGMSHYLRLKRYHRQLTQENTNLRDTVSALEARNQQWEDEVRQMRGAPQSQKIVLPVAKEDLLAVDLSKPIPDHPKIKHKPPYKLAWVIPPMGGVSGGHADIFRVIQMLERAGHRCEIYFYDPLGQVDLATIQERLINYPKVKAKLFYNQPIGSCDALFATSWHTAYPVFNYQEPVKKFYFVQDFEPFFDPVGSYSALAENTYKFNLHAITLGDWLAQKLSKEYGMRCDALSFGVDTSEYKLTNTAERKKVLFYARPVTPRRGFELGVLALEEFHKQHPEYEIVFLGWDITPYDIPIPYTNKGILNNSELNQLYNECAAGLVLSFTNMSLLPLEMLAAGCIPVMNSAEHTQMAKYKKFLQYAEPTPIDLAQALAAAVADNNASQLASSAAKSAQKFAWDNLEAKLNKIIAKELG